MIAPALVVITDRFKGPDGKFNFNRLDPGFIQRTVLRSALPLANHVKAVHIDINCAGYISDQPDNTEIFTAKYLQELKAKLREMNKNLFFDIHVLGRNIFQRACMYGAIGDNVSFELKVAESEMEGFIRALKILRARNVSIGLIGNKDTTIENYYPFMEMADVLGVTTGLSGGRTILDIGLDQGFNASVEKVRLLRVAGFDRRVIFQVGVAIDTAAKIVRHGADVLVCGSILFNNLPQKNPDNELERRLALLAGSIR